MQSTPVCLPGEFHGQNRLVHSVAELDMTEVTSHECAYVLRTETGNGKGFPLNSSNKITTTTKAVSIGYFED